MKYEDILEDVCNIIRNKAPLFNSSGEDSVLELIEEINQLKDKIRTQVLDEEHETHFEGHNLELPLDFTMEAISIGKAWIKQKKNNK